MRRAHEREPGDGVKPSWKCRMLHSRARRASSAFLYRSNRAAVRFSIGWAAPLRASAIRTSGTQEKPAPRRLRQDRLGEREAMSIRHRWLPRLGRSRRRTHVSAQVAPKPTARASCNMSVTKVRSNAVRCATVGCLEGCAFAGRTVPANTTAATATVIPVANV